MPAEAICIFNFLVQAKIYVWVFRHILLFGLETWHVAQSAIMEMNSPSPQRVSIILSRTLRSMCVESVMKNHGPFVYRHHWGGIFFPLRQANMVLAYYDYMYISSQTRDGAPRCRLGFPRRKNKFVDAKKKRKKGRKSDAVERKIFSSFLPNSFAIASVRKLLKPNYMGKRRRGIRYWLWIYKVEWKSFVFTNAYYWCQLFPYLLFLFGWHSSTGVTIYFSRLYSFKLPRDCFRAVWEFLIPFYARDIEVF